MGRESSGCRDWKALVRGRMVIAAGVAAVALLGPRPSCAQGQGPAAGSAGDVRADSAFWWHVLNNSQVNLKYAPTDNDRGLLAWGVSYRMEAAARYLLVVGGADSAALAMLRKDVSNCLAARDSERDLKDYLGRTRPVWSSTYYSEPQGIRAAWMVHAAMISTGLAAAAWELETLGPADSALGDSALSAAWQAMRAFEEERRADPPTNGDYYIFSPGFPIRPAEQGKMQPLNMQAAAARAWDWIARVSRSSGAAATATRLGNLILHETSVKDSALTWLYQRGSVTDDISHGGLVASYLVTLPAGTEVDGVPLRTALRHTMRLIFTGDPDSLHVSDHIDGTTTGQSRYRGVFGQWAEVVPFSCSMFRLLAHEMWIYHNQGAQSVVGASALLEAQQTCSGSSDVIQQLTAGGPASGH